METPIRTERIRLGLGCVRSPLFMKNNIRKTLKPRKGDARLLRPQYAYFKVFLHDPILWNGNAYFYDKGKEIYKGGWGITHTLPTGELSSHPAHGPGLTKIPDITKWREQITIPPTKYSDAD